MIIELNSLDQEPRKFDLLISPDEIDLGLSGVELKGDVSVRGDIRKRIAQIDLEGTIAFAADIDCDRCLKPVPKSFLSNFEVSYVAPEHFASDREREIAGEDLATDVVEGNQLDLGEVAREQILLNLPEQVLCFNECKGLCPKCGNDRNLLDCNCDEKELDPRWSALNNLK